jgi:hypothetical protein
MQVVFARAESSQGWLICLPVEAARKRLRVAAAVVVLVVGAVVGYGLRSTPATYVNSGSVIFRLPHAQTAPNAYLSFATSLITSGNAMTKILLSPQTQRQIRNAGGTADVSLALNNLYNQAYPNYSEPIATMAAQSLIAADTRYTFAVSARVLSRILDARQAQAGVPVYDRITIQVIGVTGPIAQPGSPRRALAALAFLILLAVALAWGLIDRMIGWRPPPR